METKKSEFKPFDRVLVRDEDQEQWQAAFYDQYVTSNGAYPHFVIGNECFAQCIPYKSNEHLLWTTDSPAPKPAPKPEPWKPKDDDRYWKPKDGENRK